MLKTRFLLLSAVACFIAANSSASAAETQHIDLSTGAGIAWQFQPEGGDWQSISVPAGGWRAQGLTCDAGTYRTTIQVPASAAGQDVELNFSAINFGADILVGPNSDSLVKVTSHIDGWLPVIADVTQYVVPGKPLTVEVDVKGRKKFMVNGKYTVPEGATWDPYLEEGILRGVTLDILPPVHIDNAFIETTVGPDTIKAQVTVTNSSTTLQMLNLSASVTTDPGEKPTGQKWPAVPLEVAAGETRTIELPAMSWTLGKNSYWWPNVPYKPGYQAKLYILALDIKQGADSGHQYKQAFGFRQFVAKGNHFYLNGVHCNLRGDNLQEANFGTDAYGIRPGFGPPTTENGGWPEAVDNLQRVNFNVMRIHQIPPTPYMLDVCDRKGLMLVEESPLRGSEGGEDYRDGKDNMLNMDRELVLRDRNHPSVVIWSAANEWSEPIADAVPVILAVDPTRPIYADGAGAAPPAIDTAHYVSGFNVVPKTGATPRTDRPYGETEDIWPGDNTLRGFAWMGIGVRLRRLNGDSDLRNYTLNNAWPNFVPGESPDNEVLEIKIKGNPNEKILPAIASPWTNSNIKLLQNCYNPVAIADVDFDVANEKSDANGDWPIKSPLIATGSKVTRTIAIFNDEFSGDQVGLTWEARLGAADGKLLASAHTTYAIPLGDFIKTTVSFNTPATAGQKVYLLLTTTKDGQVCCTERQISFVTGTPGSANLAAGDYKIQNGTSGLYLGISSDGKSLVQQSFVDTHQIWTLAYAGQQLITLTNKATGQTIEAQDGKTDNGDNIVVGQPANSQNQQWKLTQGDDNYVLENSTGSRVMDDYHQSHEKEAPVVLYDANGGSNQEWDFQPIGK